MTTTPFCVAAVQVRLARCRTGKAFDVKPEYAGAALGDSHLYGRLTVRQRQRNAQNAQMTDC
jgi:hypothetical protein